MLEVIFKTFFTSMHLRYLQSVFYKGSYNFPHRQIQVVQAQIVVVLYGNNEEEVIIREVKRDFEYEAEMVFLEQYFCCLLYTSRCV